MFEFFVFNLIELNAKYKNAFNFAINGVSTVSNSKNNTILFINRLKDTMFLKLNILENCIIVINERQIDMLANLQTNNLVISSANPRLEYAQILNFILEKTYRKPQNIYSATSIGDNFKIGEGTIIGHNVIIGNHVTIGKECTIKAGAVINDNVTIGDNTIIRENSVIGGYGFGFERDEKGIPIRLPHVGGVIIGNNVEIGALTTVASGTIEPTIVEDYTKIDDHVHIAHNCRIGTCCIITACAEISGSVKVGNHTWLGPNCSIIDGISIGDNCLIGIGSVVTKSVKDGIIVSGNPGQSLESIKKERDLLKTLLMANDKCAT